MPLHRMQMNIPRVADAQRGAARRNTGQGTRHPIKQLAETAVQLRTGPRPLALTLGPTISTVFVVIVPQELCDDLFVPFGGHGVWVEAKGETTQPMSSPAPPASCASTAYATTMKLNADSVEAVPEHGGLRDAVSVACYQLDEETRVRHGSVHVLQCTRSDAGVYVVAVAETELPGVLDLKWCAARALLWVCR